MTIDAMTAYEAQFIKVQAYSIAEGHPSWIIRCPNCGKIHTHGAAEGSRSSHCRHPGQGSAPGPWLVYAGQAPEEMLIEVYGKRWRKIVADEVRQTALLDSIMERNERARARVARGR